MKPAELGNRMKVERGKRHLTQEQLAELVGVTRKTINTIERGRFIPSALLALKIARAFDLHFEEVFFLPDPKAK